MKVAIKNPLLKLVLIAMCSFLFLILVVRVILFFDSRKNYANSNIILISAQALRPDHLGYEGYRSIGTPAIDVLASESPFFENSYCTTPVPVYSYASILSGKYPSEVILRQGSKMVLDDKCELLSEKLSGEEYETIAITASSLGFKTIGFDKGFDLFEDISVKADSDIVNDITSFAVKMLGKLSTDRKPFFMWVNYPIPQNPYLVPDDFKEGTEEHPYDRQVLLLNKEISRLISEIDKDGIRRNTVVIFTAACGESLNEHKEFSHGFLLYDSSIRVPLIIDIPGNQKAGRIISTGVSHLDIFPTILDLLDIQYEAESFDGESLMPLIRGEKDYYVRDIFLENMEGYYEFGWSPLAGVISGEFKYLSSTEQELYDLRTDPYELKNIFSEETTISEKMGSKLLTCLENNRSEVVPILGKGASPKDKVILTRPPHPSMVNSIPKVIGYYRALLAEDPGNKKVKFMLGKMYYQLGEIPLAKKYLLELTRDDPGYFDAWEILGYIYSAQDILSKAGECYEKVLSLEPDNAACLNNLAWTYARRGINLEKGLAYAKKAVSLDPGNASFLDTLGQIYLEMGDFDKALENIRLASLVDMSPSNIEYTQDRIKYIKMRLKSKESEKQ